MADVLLRVFRSSEAGLAVLSAGPILATLAISLTKVWGGHTSKAGFYNNHSFKAQNVGGTLFQGNVNFGNDTNNALDTGFGYANAALGVFTQYTQQSKFVEGSMLYNQTEFYVQDNWKVNRLTLDYGLRWDAQVMPKTVDPKTTAYAAFLSDPRFPSDGTIPDQWKQFQPRVGFVWDVGQKGKTVVRGSAGVFYARQNMLSQVGSVTTNGIQQKSDFRNSGFVGFADMPVWPNLLAPSAVPAGTCSSSSSCRHSTICPSRAPSPPRTVAAQALNSSAAAPCTIALRANRPLPAVSSAVPCSIGVLRSREYAEYASANEQHVRVDAAVGVAVALHAFDVRATWTTVSGRANAACVPYRWVISKPRTPQ